MIKRIEGSNERCFGWQHDLAKLLWKFQFTWKMFLLSVTCHCSKMTNHYNILTVKPSQCSKSGSNFVSREPVEASSDCSRLRNNLCLCLLVWPAQAVLERCPKSSAIDFAAKAFYCLLEYPLGLIARWPAGVLTWNQTWTLQPDQQVVMVLSAQKNPNKPCGIRNLLRSVENAEMKYSSELISTLFPQARLLVVAGHFQNKTSQALSSSTEKF